MMETKSLPYGGQNERGACGYEPKEEYYDYRVLVVHEIVAKSRASRRDAAIGKLDIEATEERRYV